MFDPQGQPTRNPTGGPTNDGAGEDLLCRADAEALDALVECGFDANRVPEALRSRAARVAELFRLADSPTVVRSPSLADRVAASVAARRASEIQGRPGEVEHTLTKEDAAALADFADAGYDAAQTNPKHRERAAIHDRLVRLVTAGPPGVLGSPDLAARTFDLVMLSASAESRTLPMPARPVTTGRTIRGRFWDAVSVAAMLMLSASVLSPILDEAKQRQHKSACQNNLASVAGAFGQYAGSHRESLPVATAGYGGSWWDVGTPGRSNSANLYTLARTGYAKVRDLACPGNLAACFEQPVSGAMDWSNIQQVSYSYQIMFGKHQARWKSPERTVILADRSPVVLRALRRESVVPKENSPNHRQRGQDVLFADGSSRWLATPEFTTGSAARRADNIWFPWQIETIIDQARRGVEITLDGHELPASEHDTFLGP